MPGQFNAADVDQSQIPPARGRFSAADIDASPPSLGDMLKQRAMNVGRNVVAGVQQAAKPLIDVSAPKIALELYKHYKGQPNDLANIPRKALEVFAQSLAGEMAAPEAALEQAAAKPSVAAVAPTAVPVEQSVAANVADRAASATAPVRMGPGQVPPDVVNPAQASRVLAGNQGVVVGPRKLLGTGEPAPVPMPAPAPVAERIPMQNAPETYSGESALRQVLTGQDNKALLQIARSRGINVSAEAQLRPGRADALIINKIIDDFSPEELEGVRSQYLENTRMGNNLGNIGPEAWKTLALKSYFPDLKLSQARLVRTAKAIQAAKAISPGEAKAAFRAQTAPADSGDLTDVLEKSLAAARAKKKVSVPLSVPTI